MSDIINSQTSTSYTSKNSLCKLNTKKSSLKGEAQATEAKQKQPGSSLYPAGYWDTDLHILTGPHSELSPNPG